MQKASEVTPSGMLSVMGRPQAKYKYACLQAREHCLSLGIKDPVCSVASYLYPDGRVIAGHQKVKSQGGEQSRYVPRQCLVFQLVCKLECYLGRMFGGDMADRTQWL